MKIFGWLAHKDNVGDTTKWVAKTYKSLIKQNPNMEMTYMFKVLIKYRYTIMPNPKQERFLLGIADQQTGLRELVASIITIETGPTKNLPDNQQVLMGNIDEVLANYAVPQNIIFGKSYTGKVQQTIKNRLVGRLTGEEWLKILKLERVAGRGVLMGLPKINFNTIRQS